MEMSLSNRIMGYLAVRKVSSYKELKECLHMEKRRVSSTLFYLCKARRLKRLPFSTKFGKIVYLPNTVMRLVWNYCYDNDLIPLTTKIFFHEISKSGAVSTIELYDKGMDILDVRFFIDAFTKQWKILKIRNVGGFNIFYKDEVDLERYISENGKKIESLRSKEWKRRYDEGRNFEDVIERFYIDNGFETERNLWFMTSDQERLEIDILVRKRFFDFPNDRPVLIAVQCKSWLNGEHTYNLTEFLSYYCKLKQVFPSAMFHIWSYNYSKYFFTSSFAKRFPDATFYYSKHIREAFKLNLNARKIN